MVHGGTLLHHDSTITKFKSNLNYNCKLFIQMSGSCEYCSVPQGIKIIFFKFYFELEFLDSFVLIKTEKKFILFVGLFESNNRQSGCCESRDHGMI